MRELSRVEQATIKAAAGFARETIEKNAESWDTEGRVPRSFFTEAASLGLCKLIVPESEDGLGLSATGMANVNETLARHCMATAFTLTVHNNITNVVARNGSPNQIDRHLPDLMAGRSIGAFLLTEPEIGSDATAIKTHAKATEPGWVLNGSKAWISNGVNADVLGIWAQTDPGSGSRGIACFLTEATTPGIARNRPYALLGGHSLGTASFEFENCVLETGALLINPGQAFRTAMKGIDLARINVASMCCGILQRALSEAIAYTEQRTVFGQKIGGYQGIQWMLSDVATDLEAARLLTYSAAALLDKGEDATVAAAHAKKFATRVAFNRIGECMQTMGATSLSRERPLARNLAAAKMAQFLDGATEIQNLVISRSLKEVYGETRP